MSRVRLGSWMKLFYVLSPLLLSNGPFIGVVTGNAEKVFEPFYTTKTQGLGMGLSICRSIIIHHQGQIWAENNPDGGTTFYFSMPASTK